MGQGSNNGWYWLCCEQRWTGCWEDPGYTEEKCCPKDPRAENEGASSTADAALPATSIEMRLAKVLGMSQRELELFVSGVELMDDSISNAASAHAHQRIHGLSQGPFTPSCYTFFD